MNPAEEKTKEHFDAIAAHYKEEIPGPIRDHLNKKWWGRVSSYFSGRPRVIDIGCGDGTNAVFLKSKGISVVGVDLSTRLIQRGKERYPELSGLIFEGSALNLQFPEGAFDIAIMTGVLHHLYSRSEQKKAIEEALRVVRKNGVLIIRESNLINPLFRLFWNYVFPLTSKIDRFGGENWISARYLSDLFGDGVEKTFFFTFIPNFTPRRLIPLAGRVEKVLESGPLKKLSAHYIVILKKR